MSRWRRTAAVSLAAVFLYTWSGTVCQAQSVAPPPGNSPAAGSAAPSSRWPLRLDTADGLVTIYQPQLRSFDGNQIKARAAVSVLASGQQEPVFGAMWMESRVATDRVARKVQILDVTVTEARFPPSGGGVSAETLTDIMRSYNASQGTILLSLDQLSAMLEQVEQEKAAIHDISTEAPKILFVDHPAVLVVYDGQPKLMQVPNSPLIRAVNTPFFVVLDPASKTYYVKGASHWYAGENPLGPFQPAGQVPQAVSALATTSGYHDPQAPIEGAPAAAVELITATEPTELIWTDGPEEMGTIPNTDLLYISNTPSDVFLDINSQQIFVLISGRWYSAPNHNGPWTYVPPDKLPPDFARIPPNSERAEVLASVAGTQQAQDAVADTYVPQTAAIDRNNFEQPPVQYDGEPSFQSIENSPVQYGINTPNSILLVGGQYYCCYDACWYQAGTPRGPWSICASVPREIYGIPPSCPCYPCRYCYVYDSTPDFVYVGYTPGYTGCYRFNHVVVFGTGFRYKPWIGRQYYPRPWTFGFAARYNVYSNHWGFEVGRVRGSGIGWFGPRAGNSFGGFFGYGGYRPLEIRSGADRFSGPNVGFNLYDGRKDVRPDGPRRINTGRPIRQINVRPAPPRSGSPERNDVFAGPDGQVYRKTLDGWEQRQNNRWVPRGDDGTAAPSRGQTADRQPPSRGPGTQAPSRGPQPNPSDRSAKPSEGPPAELNRDYRARIQGNQRTDSSPRTGGEDSSPRQSSGGGGSASGGGGGARGGGGGGGRR